MTVSKTPKLLILFVILALAGAVVLAGCGGGGSSSSESTAEEAPPPAEEEGAEEEPAEEEEAEEPAEEEEEEAGGESAASGEGKTIFSTNCASCHTLKAAGASGQVGPNLDELKPDEERVEKQVITGGGPMPAFGTKEILTPEEITTVSEYVAAEAGK
ncbi:MAG: c-type cytochrome [Solirubrobacterales bacterium]